MSARLAVLRELVLRLRSLALATLRMTRGVMRRCGRGVKAIQDETPLARRLESECEAS
jgi:cob(I)alamin adenosyltransferase